MTGEPQDWYAAWEGTLAELEMTLEQAEAMLTAGHDETVEPAAPWVPPEGIGTIPAPLVERARTLRARQIEVAERLAAAATSSRREGRAVSRMSLAMPAPPVYIDTPA